MSSKSIDINKVIITEQDINLSDFFLSKIFLTETGKTKIFSHISMRIPEVSENKHDFLNNLLLILDGDPYLWILVDKENTLNENFIPHDLVEIKTCINTANSGYMLRKEASDSLAEMISSAGSEGLALTVLSAYRSFNYQNEIYTYYREIIGLEEVDMISARPGHSQHQLGLAVDFNFLDNEQAFSPEGIWLSENASRFGWSLSYPQGYEEITGFYWESWHYRYVGRELAGFIDKYFEGIQQNALLYINDFFKQLNDLNIELHDFLHF